MKPLHARLAHHLLPSHPPSDQLNIWKFRVAASEALIFDDGRQGAVRLEGSSVVSGVRASGVTFSWTKCSKGENSDHFWLMRAFFCLLDRLLKEATLPVAQRGKIVEISCGREWDTDLLASGAKVQSVPKRRTRVISGGRASSFIFRRRCAQRAKIRAILG